MTSFVSSLSSLTIFDLSFQLQLKAAHSFERAAKLIWQNIALNRIYLSPFIFNADNFQYRLFNHMFQFLIIFKLNYFLFEDIRSSASKHYKLEKKKQVLQVSTCRLRLSKRKSSPEEREESEMPH